VEEGVEPVIICTQRGCEYYFRILINRNPCGGGGGGGGERERSLWGISWTTKDFASALYIVEFTRSLLTFTMSLGHILGLIFAQGAQKKNKESARCAPLLTKRYFWIM